MPFTGLSFMTAILAAACVIKKTCTEKVQVLSSLIFIVSVWLEDKV